MTVSFPSNYSLIDRNISLLAFNRRVLELAQDPDTPLLERMRYLCILGSNLDEMFELRLGFVQDALLLRKPPAGMTMPQLRAHVQTLSDIAHELVRDQYETLNREVLPELSKHNIRVLFRTEISGEVQAWAKEYFTREVRPLLSPIGLDPAHPFPQVVNKSLNFIVELSG
ncbi:MAG: RNA degradosome polyphosphate kinase, partial [Burkholderiales bacterium]|nr:RNA degradosome polyphosphate kinase [Burkholderiales bacterium]